MGRPHAKGLLRGLYRRCSVGGVQGSVGFMVWSVQDLHGIPNGHFLWFIKTVVFTGILKKCWA